MRAHSLSHSVPVKVKMQMQSGASFTEVEVMVCNPQRYMCAPSRRCGPLLQTSTFGERGSMSWSVVADGSQLEARDIQSGGCR